TLQDRVSGAPLPIGAAGAPGRAVARIADGVFHFPAVAAEGDVVVFLEPEALEGPPKGTGGMDRTGDGLVVQTMLRVVAGGQLVTRDTPALPADAAPVIDGRSVAIANGAVVYRADPVAAEPRVETRIIGNKPTGTKNPSLSADGRYLAFVSDADNLVPGD